MLAKTNDWTFAEDDDPVIVAFVPMPFVVPIFTVPIPGKVVEPNVSPPILLDPLRLMKPPPAPVSVSVEAPLIAPLRFIVPDTAATAAFAVSV